MPRETVYAKATRYLTEGRVVIVRVDRRAVVTNVRGSGCIYRTTWHAGTWACDCPHMARTTDCSHVAAVKRVVAVDLGEAER